MVKEWIVLIVGGLCEAGWAFCLNKAKDSGNLVWTIAFASLYVLSAICLAYASKRVPVGTAYAVWTGIGATCTIVLGMWIFNEPASSARIIFLSMILIAVIGLEIIT